MSSSTGDTIVSGIKTLEEGISEWKIFVQTTHLSSQGADHICPSFTSPGASNCANDKLAILEERVPVMKVRISEAQQDSTSLFERYDKDRTSSLRVDLYIIKFAQGICFSETASMDTKRVMQGYLSESAKHAILSFDKSGLALESARVRSILTTVKDMEALLTVMRELSSIAPDEEGRGGASPPW